MSVVLMVAERLAGRTDDQFGEVQHEVQRFGEVQRASRRYAIQCAGLPYEFHTTVVLLRNLRMQLVGGYWSL